MPLIQVVPTEQPAAAGTHSGAALAANRATNGAFDGVLRAHGAITLDATGRAVGAELPLAFRTGLHRTQSAEDLPTICAVHTALVADKMVVRTLMQVRAEIIASAICAPRLLCWFAGL